MTNAGGAAALKMLHGGIRTFFQWNSRAFRRSSKDGNERGLTHNAEARLIWKEPHKRQKEANVASPLY